MCLLHGVLPVAVSCILCHVSVTRCSAGSCVLYFICQVFVTRCSAGSRVLYFMSLLHSVVSVVVYHILYIRSLLHGVVPVAESCILCHVSVTRCSAGSRVLYFMSCVCYTV